MWGLSVLRRRQSRNQQLKQAAAVAIESLESRTLLSAVGWAAIKYKPVYGTLQVGGTGRSDAITIGIDAADHNLIDVNLNGTAYQFNKADVNYIFINSFGGNDFVKVDETNGLLPMGVTVRGGVGSDRLVGSSLGDNLFGGDGRDYLVGNGGNDTLNGAGGNDKAWGGLGDDVLHGMDGNDWLVGGFGNDRIYGDGGADRIDSSQGTDVAYGGYGNNDVNSAVAKGLTPLYDAGDSTPNYNSGGNFGPAANIATPGGVTVPQERTAYGFGDLNDPLFTTRGQGQSIAIVIAFDIANAANDLQTFSNFYGLTYDPSRFKVVYASGSKPISDPSGTNGWDIEANLDVQWSHAMAPEATIYLVEADSNSFDDINTAIRVAAQTLVDNNGGGVVNMSLGTYNDLGGEIGSDATEAIFNNNNFKDVSFVAASGDQGARPGYPGTSPNVLSVGGTALQVDSSGNYLGETPWVDSSGGYSDVFPTPAYQIGVTVNGAALDNNRVSPDVALNGDPATSVSIYTSFPAFDMDGDGNPDTGWVDVGGTSASAPQWSGLVALGNQARAEAGLGKIGQQITAKIYALGTLNQSLYFHDINTGSIGPFNGTSYAAFDGFDIASGWGTPRATEVISGIADNAIQGAQVHGFVWNAEYREAIEKYPGGVSVPLFADFLGSGQARVTGTQISLALTLEQQYNGRLLQITFPILNLDANKQFRGTGTATVVGPLTFGFFNLAIAGQVYTDSNGQMQVAGSWDAVSPITGQLPVDGAEETFRGEFTTDH